MSASPRLLLLALLSGCGSLGLQEFGDPQGPAMIVDPAELDFGRVAAGQSVELELRFLSSGDDGVLIEDILLRGGDGAVFTPRDLPTPRVVQPGVEMPLVVRFTPSQARAYAATLVLDTPGLEGGTVITPLRGEGCADPDRDGRCSP